MARARGYTEVKTPQLYDAAAVARPPATGTTTSDNMFITDRRRAPDGPQADELPGPLRALRDGPPLLPRAAGALLRARAAAPQGALGHAPRPAARAQLRAGRRAHLLHRGADPATRSPAAWTSASRSTGCSASRRGIELSTRPEKRIGDDALWDHAEARADAARSTASASTYQVNEGDGAFYGPKIDMHMTDSLGRSWQLGTVQLDYNLPERFELAYTGADNAEHRPVMIHRALFGSLRALHRRSCSSTSAASCRSGSRRCRRSCCRSPTARTRRRAAVARRARAPPACAASSTSARESVGRKIRDAELRKIPYMLVVGEREAAAGTVVGARARRAATPARRRSREFVARLRRDRRRAPRARVAQRERASTSRRLRPAILVDLGHRTTRNAAQPRLRLTART